VAGGGAPLIYANRAYGVPRQFLPRSALRPAIPQAQLNVGCYEVFAPYVMPALVARAVKLHPDLAVNVVESDQTRLDAGLRRGDTELALLYDFGLDADFSVTPLAELTPYVLLADGHPLAAAASLSLRELASEPLVLLDLEPSRDYFLSMFRERALQPLIAHRTRSLEMVRGLVGHGVGYSILATKPANNMSYDGRALVTRPLSDRVKNSQLVLASLARKPLSPAAQEFAVHCRAFFGAAHAYAHS
jgi:DNA-binding transcriptional LysR family regulator